MQGEFFVYNERRQLSGFISFPPTKEQQEKKTPSKCFLFISGLTNGFLAVPYISPIAQKVSKLGFSFTQVSLLFAFYFAQLFTRSFFRPLMADLE
jgi:hypothetical protein